MRKKVLNLSRLFSAGELDANEICSAWCMLAYKVALNFFQHNIIDKLKMVYHRLGLAVIVIKIFSSTTFHDKN